MMLRQKTNYQGKRNGFSAKPPRAMSDRYVREELDGIVRLILPYIETHCFTCSIRHDGLQVGHLFERRHLHTRWDTTIDGNNHLQCPKCNQRHESHPDIYKNKYIDRFGVELYRQLEIRAHSKMKLTYSDLLELLESKEAQLAKLKGKAA